MTGVTETSGRINHIEAIECRSGEVQTMVCLAKYTSLLSALAIVATIASGMTAAMTAGGHAAGGETGVEWHCGLDSQLWLEWEAVFINIL